MQKFPERNRIHHGAYDTNKHQHAIKQYAYRISRNPKRLILSPCEERQTLKKVKCLATSKRVEVDIISHSSDVDIRKMNDAAMI